MKKVLWCVAAVYMFMFSSSSFAMDAAAVDDNTYNVVLLCMGDAGDYCNQYQTVNDEFVFDDGDFSLESFEDELWGMGGDGSYSESGISFSADFEVVNDDLDMYEFDITGVQVLGQIIVGTAEIEFYEWDIIDYDKEGDATAYFFGIKK